MGKQNKGGRPKKSALITRSDLYQSIFMFKGEPLSYDDYPFWIDILNSPRLSNEVDMAERKVVFKCSRQVAKSTNIAILASGISIERKNFKTIVAQPTDVQISRFSVDTLKTLNNGSIVTDKIYYDRKTTERQVKNKSYTTGSRIILANIFSSALSARGISADMAIFDEYQDIPQKNALVVQNGMNRSPNRFLIYSGTPKEPENDLEQKWQQSTMNEWVVRCRYCGHENGPLGGTEDDKFVKHIGKNGLICEKCHHRIYAEDGRWVMFNPPTKNSPRFIEGWHINELMIPRNAPGATSWKEIKRKVAEEPMVIIKNEFLGLSYSDASKPITSKMIIQSCRDYEYIKDIQDAPNLPLPGGYVAFAGLDWAMETSPRAKQEVLKSYTMLSIGIYDMMRRKMKVVFVKKYYDHESTENDDPDFVVADIVRWCEAFDITLLGADYGVGHANNQRIKAAIGDDRVMEIQYIGGQIQKKYVAHLDTGHWTADRTTAMSETIELIKDGYFEFAKYAGETSEYANDLTTVYKYNNPLTRTTSYGKRGADDWLQNLVYMSLAQRFAFEELEYITKGMMG